MNEDMITEIQDILSDVDTILRERHAAIGLEIPTCCWRSLLTVAFVVNQNCLNLPPLAGADRL